MRRLALASVTAIGCVAFAAPAYADCVPPTTAPPGTTVTCTGTAPNGFGDGTQNNLTVNILSGATVIGTQPVGAPTGINLSDNNTVTNAGTINGIGAGAIGIGVNDTNTINNTGTIAMSDVGSIGIQAGANATITNNGTITLSSQFGFGILLLGSNGTVTNNGTITAGSNSFAGIYDASGGNFITNNGTITVGTDSFGIVTTATTQVVNNGTIIVGDSTSPGPSAGGGILAEGGQSITNNGTIRVGANANGIFLGDGDNLVVNTGRIVAGANGLSILSFGDNNGVLNSGTIDGAFLMFGIGDGVLNSGLITITNPGTPVGVQFVAGDLFAQAPSGTLALRVDSSGAFDSLGATQVFLDGTLRLVVQPGLYGASAIYDGVVISCTCGFNGTFASIVSSSPFFSVTYHYYVTGEDPNPLLNDPHLSVTLNRLGFGSVPGETQNQRSVGNVLEGGYSPTLTDPNAIAFYSALLGSTSITVLDAISGQGTAQTQNSSFTAGTLFFNTLMSQLSLWNNGLRGGTPDNGTPLGYAATRDNPALAAFASFTKVPVRYRPTWNVWTSAFGGTQSFNGDATLGSSSSTNRSGGGALGIDYEANPSLLIGLGVGASTSNFSVSDLMTSGRVDGGHIGAYAMQRWGASYASLLAGYSHYSNATERTIVIGGTSNTANGSFGSDQFGARVEVGHRFTYRQFGVMPFAAAQVSELWQQGFTETGGGLFNLSFAAKQTMSLPTFLGAELDTRTVFSDGTMLSPFVRAAWVHEFYPTRQITASFVTLPGASFTVDGARPAGDALKLDAGLRFLLTKKAAVMAAFTGEFSGQAQSYTGNAGLKVVF